MKKTNNVKEGMVLIFQGWSHDAADRSCSIIGQIVKVNNVTDQHINCCLLEDKRDDGKYEQHNFDRKTAMFSFPTIDDIRETLEIKNKCCCCKCCCCDN